MFLKSSNGKTVRNTDDLRAIGKTMKLTYKTIKMENEDTDFQFYDRLLTRTIDKIVNKIGVNNPIILITLSHTHNNANLT